MIQPTMQEMLDENIEIVAQFQGPIHQSKKDCLLALTESAAIAIFTIDSASSQQQKPEMLTIPRTQLSFAQRENFPRTHIAGVGGSKFGQLSQFALTTNPTKDHPPITAQTQNTPKT